MNMSEVKDGSIHQELVDESVKRAPPLTVLLLTPLCGISNAAPLHLIRPVFVGLLFFFFLTLIGFWEDFII